LNDKPAEWEGRYACVTCPLGAVNAGVQLAATASLSEALRTVCPRCLQLRTRFIGGERCVSCYNRERELRIGRNAKGRLPVLLASRLHVRPLIRVGADCVAVLIQSAPIVGLVEALVSEARYAQAPFAYARVAMRPVSPQLRAELVGGLAHKPLLLPQRRIVRRALQQLALEIAA
jgi:hypothetical protein